MSRSGFTLPRLQQDALEAPGLAAMPAVSGGSAVASQVRDVLAATGQAAYTLGRQQQIASAEEDTENRGVAHLQAQRDIVPTGIELEEEILGLAMSGGDVTNEAISSLIDSKISRNLADLTVNEAGAEQYKSELTRYLNGAAFGARQKALDKLLADRRVDASSDFGTGDYQRTYDALKAIDPLLTDQGIKALAVPHLKSAAERGERDVVMALADGIGRDSIEVKGALWTLDRVEMAAHEQAANDRVSAAREAVASHLRDRNIIGAKDAVAGADIPESEKLLLEENLEDRQKQIADADKNEHLTGFYNTLSRLAVAGDTKGYEAAVVRAQASGLIEEADIPVLNAKYGVHLAKQMEGTAQVSVNALRRATTDEERVAAYQTIAETLAAADAALARPAGSAGRIEQDQYSEIVRIAEPVVEQMQTIDFQQQHVTRLLAESETAGGADFKTMTVGDTEWTDIEQAAAVADKKWQLISATVEEPADRMRDMTDWLAKNPVAVWSDLQREYKGFVGRAFAAANNPDQPERLAGVRAGLNNLAAVYQTNPEVARRHVPANAGELLDFMVLVGDLIPLDDDEALYGALFNIVSQEGPVEKYNLTPDDRKMIDSALKNNGFGDGVENIIDIRREAYSKARAMANVFGGNMDTISRRVGESYKSTWQKSDGMAIRVSSDSLGVSIGDAYSIASRAAKGVWLKTHKGVSRSDLVLDKDPLGRYRLYEKGSFSPVEDSPTWTSDDLRRISSAYRNAGTAIAENKGTGKALLSQAERDTSVGMSRAPGVVGVIGGAAESAFGSVSRMVSSRILGKRHKSWKEKFIQQNTRDLDEWEKYAVEMLGRKTRVPRSNAEAEDMTRGSDWESLP